MKTLGLNTSVATRSRSETKSENSAKSNEEESEPSIQDERLSSGQVKVIEMLFSNQIISQASITFDIMRQTIAKHMDLRKFVDDPKMAKKIYDEVCYLRRKEKQNMVLPSKDPQPSSSWTEACFNAITEVEAVSVACSRVKGKWNKPDETYVENLFAKYPVRPNKEDLKTLVHSLNGLKEFLDKNDGDFERCYSNVTYMFKKRGANK